MITFKIPTHYGCGQLEGDMEWGPPALPFLVSSSQITPLAPYPRTSPPEMDQQVLGSWPAAIGSFLILGPGPLGRRTHVAREKKEGDLGAYILGQGQGHQAIGVRQPAVGQNEVGAKLLQSPEVRPLVFHPRSVKRVDALLSSYPTSSAPHSTASSKSILNSCSMTSAGLCP